METVNQDATVNEEQRAEARTFTQEEVNAIVQKRLDRARADFADYDDLKAKAEKYDRIEEESKSELQKAQEKAQALQTELEGLKRADAVRAVRDKVAQETGVPASLLSGETEEDCMAQAEGILSFAKPNAYPAVKDAGEVRKSSNRSTKEQFAEWAKENL